MIFLSEASIEMICATVMVSVVSLGLFGLIAYLVKKTVICNKMVRVISPEHGTCNLEYCRYLLP